jgi:hypothetical protein
MPEKIETRKSDDDGLFAIAVNSTAELGEKTVSAYFGMLRDVRGEMNQRTNGLIDWLEASQQSFTRLLRSLNQRLDEVAVAGVNAGEGVSLGVVRAVWNTSHGATMLASRTASSLTGSNRSEIARA